MRAVVYRGRDAVEVEERPEPRIQDTRDAIVRVTLTTICGTDIHLVNGSLPGMKPGTILGHECVGVIDEVGPDVKNLKRGDRVICLSTVACGLCRYCARQHYSHCERTPVGPETCFFGGPANAGSLDGMMADLVRVPFADVGCIKIPQGLDEVAALVASDVFPTALFGVRRAPVEYGDRVVVLGAGPIGQFAVLGARMAGAQRVVVIDKERERLHLAKRFPEVETIEIGWTSPVKEAKALLEETHGADVVIECVGVDASSPLGFNAPSRTLEYAAALVRPEGRIAILGVFPSVLRKVPLGDVLSKNVTITGGNCNHRAHVEEALGYLVEHPQEGRRVFTHKASLEEFPDAYETFVAKRDGVVKCLLVPEASPAKQKLTPYAAGGIL